MESTATKSPTPDLATRRTMLEAARDDFSQQAYGNEIQAEALAVQDADAEAKARKLAEYRLTARNCRAAANRMQELLDNLERES